MVFEGYYKKDYVLKNGFDAAAIIEYLNQVGCESDNLLFGKDVFHLTVEQEMEYIKKVRNDSNTLMVIGVIIEIIVHTKLL